MLTRTVDDIMKQQLSPLDLTQPQFAIIMNLLEKDGVSQTAIGKLVIMPGYAMTRNLDALEKKGLIERQTDESSRRSFQIVLTDQGRELAPTLFAIIAKVNGDLLDGLDEKEVTQLKALLTKLLAVNSK